MTADTAHDGTSATSDAAEHVTEARQRARQMLSSEAHLGAVDDWRRVLVSARDALIFIWLTWVALYGFGNPAYAGLMLVAMAIALAVLIGISTGRSTYMQVQYYSDELERERGEIRDSFEHEREEVRVLYAAKGFREPLLDQVVDTIVADDDRLLKVMMEEELGLFIHHVPHPLIVGIWNFAGALVAGLALALPVVWLSSTSTWLWVTFGGTALLAVVSTIATRATRRTVLEFFMVGLMMAVVTGGVAYYLAQWFSRFLLESPVS